jgi:hypothetical protein
VKIFRRWQVYVWIASGAGWAVIAYYSSLVEAGLASVLCLGMAVIWNDFVDLKGEGHPKRKKPNIRP